ncbi:c-type cytochrome [Congregibacter variabilis]|uniref:C-type cytochrome n=1 Tax=Congregibacter variabilis TaxID=3081200 RepID=A0ABZ0HZY5_9GAMM|nr:c-type cytochrome [Congregibacter sp. IMCC43200]
MNIAIKAMRFRWLIAVFGGVLLSACSGEKPPVKGFVLPDGDIEKGAMVFVEMGCAQCHTVADSDIQQPQDSKIQVKLGGNIRYVKHYGDLLTSIVIPDHRISSRYQPPTGEKDIEASPMPNFTGDMSVAQLIDVAEFLHSKYTTIPTYAGKYYYYAP